MNRRKSMKNTRHTWSSDLPTEPLRSNLLYAFHWIAKHWSDCADVWASLCLFRYATKSGFLTKRGQFTQKKKTYSLYVYNNPTASRQAKLRFWPFCVQKRFTVNVLKFRTLIACQKGLDKLGRSRSDCFWRSSLIRKFPVCYSLNHFVNSSTDNQHFIGNSKWKVFEVLEHLPYYMNRSSRTCPFQKKSAFKPTNNPFFIHFHRSIPA